jgi:hypothetical protein
LPILHTCPNTLGKENITFLPMKNLLQRSISLLMVLPVDVMGNLLKKTPRMRTKSPKIQMD